MTKLEFLTELERRLKGLGRREIDDIVTEYSTHIDNKMADGFTEEQAIESFGDLDDLIEDIKSAYNVDPDFKHKSFRNYVSYYVGLFTDFITQTTQCFVRMNRRQLLVFVARILVLLAVLLLLKVPVDLVIHSFSSLFSFLPNVVYRFIRGLISCIFNLCYLVVCLYVAYIYIKQLLQPMVQQIPPEQRLVTRPVPLQQDDGEQRSAQSKYGAYMPQKAAAVVADGFAGLMTVILKIALLIVLIPAVVLIAGMCVGFGSIVVLAMQGYPLIGASIVLFGAMLCGLAVVVPVIGFVFRREVRQ